MRNPPLHGVRIVGSNMIEVDHGEAYILYSYETPVAVLLRTGPVTGGPIVTTKVWSRTTSKHIGTWLRDRGYSGARDPNVKHASQEEVERIAREGMRANPHEPYQPKTGVRCSCRPGVERDNCPVCEGTGWVVDFRAIRERTAPPRRNPPDDNPTFDSSDVGTWIDGAYGTDHALAKMADMLKMVDPAGATLLDEYDEGIDPEFEQEWLDDATEVISDATEEGLCWDWDSGDLVLLPCSELEP